MIAPSVPVTVGRLEKDIEKLGSLYWMGYHDAESDLASLRAYLKKINKQISRTVSCNLNPTNII